MPCRTAALAAGMRSVAVGFVTGAPGVTGTAGATAGPTLYTGMAGMGGPTPIGGEPQHVVHGVSQQPPLYFRQKKGRWQQQQPLASWLATKSRAIRVVRPNMV